MAFIDFIILLLIIWAIYKGWQAGFIKEIMSMIGFFAGLLVAAALYSNFGEYLAPRIGAAPAVSDIIAFVMLWVIVPILLGLVANILTKALKGMKMGLPNSVLGAVVSTLKYMVLMSCIFNVMSFTGMISSAKAKESLLYEPVKGSLEKAFHLMNRQKVDNESVPLQEDNTKPEETTQQYPQV